MTSASSEMRALIIGAGIGGLSAAIALGKRGVKAHLVERSKSWDVYGVGIILQSNAIRALDALGLSDACVAEGFPYSVSSYFDAAGNMLRNRPKPNVGDSRFPSSCGIQRRSLHRILSREALSLGAHVDLGTTVTSLTQHASHVEAQLSDGRRLVCDLVIGSDGVNSATRQMLFGDVVRPVFTGQGCWRFTAPRLPEVDRAIFQRGEKSVAGLIPLANEQMYLLLLTPEPENPWFKTEELQAGLAQRLEGYGGLVGKVASKLPAGEDIVYRPLEPLLLPAPWAKGRVVLIGDAVHSTTPHLAQGASMAFEDAVVLGELLFDSGLDVPSALARFTSRRFARCQRIVETSKQLGCWQLEQWAGRGYGNADPVGLSAQVLEELRAPI
ncbi:FAD-dependent monooxygenase [Pigmentiphaga sp. GD03639]|uniref:FAD-dependent monooxygenase n=1 Tax=Pigmentiphaga sp. GD03639 TaxID=2975354 RepID=UPI00244D022E|nr:FAD-dependent monooxygenase [Pigmentiphaga sp. GD03639]MDH2234705.1 FAD-dependent monooxygenase [Pigmentiphaga sp. GD03639]